MCFIVCALFSFNFGLSVFCFVFFLSCICYKLLIISLMKAASIDGPFGLLVSCPMFNIEMLYCEFVSRQIKMLAKMLACISIVSPHTQVITIWDPCLVI